MTNMFEAQFIVSLILIILFVAIESKTIRALFLSYFFINSAITFGFDESYLTRKNALVELISLFFIFLLVLTNKQRLRVYIGYILLIAASFEIIMLEVFRMSYGIFNAHTFGASAILLLSMTPKHTVIPTFLRTLLAIAAIITALDRGGTTSYAILSLILLFTISDYIKPKYWLFVSWAGLILIAIFKDKIFDFNGRLEMWKAYLDHWSNNYNMIYGSGIGSFEQIAQKININDSYYIHAHNDFLQIYLETGIIGLVIFTGFLVLTFIKILKIKDIQKKKNLVCVFLSFIITMMTYFPMQMTLTQLAFGLLLFAIWKDKQRGAV